MKRLFNLFFCLSISLVMVLDAQAKVERVEITSQRIFAEGHDFGETGSYETLAGTVFYAVDPDLPANVGIVDLDKAKRGRDGLVHFKADLFILKAVDLTKGNGAILYDVNNRGNKLALRLFNDAPSTNDPRSLTDSGDGFLMRQGYTIVWSGWDGELLPADHRLRLLTPVATDNGKEITGIVRAELFADLSEDRPTDTLSVSWSSTSLDLHGGYPPTERGKKQATLTWRLREKDPRVPIPRSQWEIITRTFDEGDPTWTSLPQVTLHLPSGFRPGYLYELLYEAKNPVVMGLGFAAVRDLVSWLRFTPAEDNPLRDSTTGTFVRYVYGFGVSQSGRFLRDFLYQGFNADEEGRQVFDGLIPHAAGGGRGFFNARFAQPTRTNFQHDGHLYPVDTFPFTYADITDPFTGRTDGILHQARSAGTVPFIMHVNTTAEYWTRSGSLAHTDPQGQNDAEIPDSVRMYAFDGTQHGTGHYPAKRSSGQQLDNPTNYVPLLKALLVGLDTWARGQGQPPPSAYPRIDQGTLVDWKQETTGFPLIPGIRYPEVIQQPSLCDYGPHFPMEGIITMEPPAVWADYTVKVPRCDQDGNPLGGIRLPDVEVPLATFTGWNLRNRSAGAENELVSMNGSYIPFPKTREDRFRQGDPSLSVEERYRSFEDYIEKYTSFAKELVAKGYLLEEDVEPMLQEREQFRDLFSH